MGSFMYIEKSPCNCVNLLSAKFIVKIQILRVVFLCLVERVMSFKKGKTP